MTTKMKIMKAAEELFAHAGFHHTTMRAITGKAGVNLSAINYHFGSKEALLAAIFDLHLTPINDERVRRLNDIGALSQQTGNPPDLEEVLRAFMEPTLALFQSCACGTHGAHFCIIIGRALSEPNKTVREIFLQRVMPVIEILMGLLCQSMPQTSREDVSWKLRFALGAMSHTLSSHLQRPPIELGQEKAITEVIDLLIRFTVRGMQE